MEYLEIQHAIVRDIVVKQIDFNNNNFHNYYTQYYVGATNYLKILLDLPALAAFTGVESIMLFRGFKRAS